MLPPVIPAERRGGLQLHEPTGGVGDRRCRCNHEIYHLYRGLLVEERFAEAGSGPQSEHQRIDEAFDVRASGPPSRPLITANG